MSNMSESDRFYWLEASRFTIKLHIAFFKKDNPDMNVRS